MGSFMLCSMFEIFKTHPRHFSSTARSTRFVFAFRIKLSQPHVSKTSKSISNGLGLLGVEMLSVFHISYTLFN